jgi:hypothetical protein
MRGLASGLALAVLAGCVSSTAGPDCRDPALQALVGQPLSALAARVPDGSYKVDYPLPDGAVTLEDFPDRLRVSVDESDVIVGLGCG